MILVQTLPRKLSEVEKYGVIWRSGGWDYTLKKGWFHKEHGNLGNDMEAVYNIVKALDYKSK